MARTEPLATLPSYQLYQEEFKVPEGVTLLTEDEIRDKIIENTMTGREYGKKWWENYRSDGEIRGIRDAPFDKDRYRGQWMLSGPVMCFDKGYWAVNKSGDGCWTMSLEGGTAYFYTMDGEPDSDAKLREGNARGL